MTADPTLNRPMSGYVSPLMNKANQERLSLELLRELIPKIHAGQEAHRLLQVKSGKRSENRVNNLTHAYEAGQNAKERVYLAALPLIRSVAHKEWGRRQQWESRISLEDLIESAIIGFFKGINAFNIDSIKTSPTNYLGQWMLVEMRRSSEVMDHDLSVTTEAAERFRKVRALRSRLAGELNREPTDQEISDASQDPSYARRPGFVGKADLGDKPRPIKGLTTEHVEAERSFRSRMGAATRFDSDDSDDSNGGAVDSERVITDSTAIYDPAEIVADNSATDAVSGIVAKALITMRIPKEQEDVIRRRFGLPPHPNEASIREITVETGIYRERVVRILGSFQEEMTKTGGHFHAAVSTISADDLIAIGMGWLLTSLGEWPNGLDPHNPTSKLPQVLTENRSATPAHVEATITQRRTTNSPGVIVWFNCDFHNREFAGLYPSKRNAPKRRACPACGRPSLLVRIQDPEEE